MSENAENEAGNDGGSVTVSLPEEPLCPPGWAAKPRCHRFGEAIMIVYGDDEEPWPSYSIWIVPSLTSNEFNGLMEDVNDRSITR